MRKWIVVLGIAIVVVVGALALIAVNLNSSLDENRDWVSEQAESALGRSVSFGKARISLLGFFHSPSSLNWIQVALRASPIRQPVKIASRIALTTW